MSKKLVLTGGAGFIGHHMVDYVLLNTDWDIVVIDSLTYAGDAMRVPSSPRVRVLWHDFRAPISDSIFEVIKEANYFVNMASESHVENSIARPAEFIHNNVMLAINTLEAARKMARLEAFVQISTDEVYGPALPGVSHKEWDAHIPSNPYAASKSAQEAIAISYWRTFGVPVVLTNTMNNFGERQHREKFIPMCVRKVLCGETIQIHGAFYDDQFVSGSRVWLHAENHASALTYILRELPPIKYPHSDRPNRFHIAGLREISNLEIAREIARILGMELQWSGVDFHSTRPGHDLRYSLDGCKLNQAGWAPPVSHEEAFERAVLWHVNELTPHR